MIHLQRASRPLVSIVVVAFSRRDRIELCLRSLEAHLGDGIAVETIVVLNGMQDDIRDLLTHSVRGVTLVPSQVNLGFAGACNAARRRASGSYLALLNDDAEIEDSWLQHLLAVADAHPDAGAVGSTILSPQGALQEAGSVIWGDGSTSPVGRGADRRAYDFVRDVDYCSACSLLVRARTWDEVGGMDDEYFPAYYEDVDLCLRIRTRGERVLYAPRSRVRHHEYSSTDAHFREFLIGRNRLRFRERWRQELEAFEPAAPHDPVAVERALMRARGHPRRLLIVDDRLPDASLGSGFARMLDVIGEVAGDYAVSFWCSADPSQRSAAIGDLGVRVVDGPLDLHLSTPEVLYDAILVSRAHNIERCGELIRTHQPQAALIYDAEALYHRRIERRLALEFDDRARSDQVDEWQRLRTVEENIRSKAHAVVCVSQSEAAFFQSCRGDCRVWAITPAVPWARITPRRFEERSGALFVAAWLAGPDSPNGDGLRWFVESVWPRVLATAPSVRLTITGDAPASLRSAVACSSVEFAGCVPDLFDTYDAARLAIVPLRYGAGVSIKALEALRFGVPMVTTALGASGLDDVDPSALLRADTPRAFADGVTALLTDPDEWNRQRLAILGWRASRKEAGHQWRTVIDEAQFARTAAW